VIAVYALVKFIAYSIWCAAGLRIAASSAATLRASLSLGAVRWLLGLVFGAAIFFLAGAIDVDSATRLYFTIYSPVRVVEWGIMAWLIASRRGGDSRPASIGSLAVWCLGGILVSFLTDALSPDGLQGRFCVGRCLC
jgi:hypothetical protein